MGAEHTDLQWVFEQDPSFTVLPTFGVIPGLEANTLVDLALLPNYSLKMVLHGEQYLEIRKWPLPPSGTLVTTRLSEFHWNRADNRAVECNCYGILYTTTQRLKKREEASLP